MNSKTIVAIAAILVVLGAGYALAGSAQGGFWDNMMGGYGYGNRIIAGYGNGMMGSGGMMENFVPGNGMIAGYGNGIMGAGGMMGNFVPGNGMIAGYGNGIMGAGGMMGNFVPGNGMIAGYGNGMMGAGGMMGNFVPGNGIMAGYGNGMMGSGSMMGEPGYGNQCGAYAAGNGEDPNPISIDEAKKSVEQYLTATGNNDLELAEVIQFDNHFYAGIKEKSTGKYAFELIVDKYTEAVGPEMGPNMMWNTKYGHMNIGKTETTVTEEQAIKNAQEYLDTTLPGTKVGDTDAFYGYYTMEVTKDGKIYGMLSVNSNTGAVWYHRWHGTFVKLLEVE